MIAMAKLITGVLTALMGLGRHSSPQMPWIAVAKDKRGFVLEPSGKAFTPWGFNYDHDHQGRLLEDYWNAEWTKVERDFRTMKKLGANVVRIHLQVARFMDAPDQPNPKALTRLERLLRLAETEGLYLDLTGLGCYHKQDVPPMVRQTGREGPLAGASSFLVRRGGSLRCQSRDFLLRLDERAGGAGR
jgi:hypothetical protein